MRGFTIRVSRTARFYVIATVSLLLACFVFISTPKASAVPSTMNFQGRLADSTGNTVTDGLYNMQFRLFTVGSGGSSVWDETRETTNRVQVTNGLFSTKLGEVSAIPASLFASGNLYFEITLATPGTATCGTAACATWESPMTPRHQMSTSAYAFNSETLDGLDSGAFAQLSANNAFSGTSSITTASANAFTVGNASNLFRVDTSNSQVLIGTSDTTGSVLVLDTKTDAGDPSGTNGAMYYNSTLNKLRCYQNGGWLDCLSAGASTTLQGAYDNSTTPATITTSSAAKTLLLKAGSGFDAAALFDIQDAAGLSMFTVDSANDRVYVGDSAPDATGTVLVLDTKNTTVDPTGVDGAMYYNSEDKNFRCYKNGLWTDCSFASLRSEWVLQEDFLDAGVATATIGTYEWTLTDTSTATEAKVNAATDASNRDRWGIFQTTTGATAGSGNYLRLDPNAMAGTPSNMTVEFDHGPSNAAAADGTQTTVRIGLMTGTTTSADPTDGIYFQYATTTTAGNWFRCTQNNNAVTCTDTGVARTLTPNTYQRFKFVTNSAGTSVEFFIDEVSVGTNTTDLPASTRSHGPAISMHTANATARAWKMDYYQIKRNLTTLR